jgi:hypothetical protein
LPKIDKPSSPTRFLALDATKTLLIGEIQRNCEFVLIAYEDIVRYSQSMQPGDSKTLNRFWLSVESFLISLANISKILWPSRSDKCNKCGFQPELSQEVSTRRGDLRTILSIDGSSPLKSRKFRNHFEHYDFRIEELAKESGNKIIIDSNIGPIESVILNPNEPKTFMRNFDQYTSILHFGGEKYDVKQVVVAVNDLLNKINTVPSLSF